jgi:hypothetical protein
LLLLLVVLEATVVVGVETFTMTGVFFAGVDGAEEAADDATGMLT